MVWFTYRVCETTSILRALVNFPRSRFIEVIYGFVDFVRLVEFYPTTAPFNQVKNVALKWTSQLAQPRGSVESFANRGDGVNALIALFLAALGHAKK